jgi:hypothetical protein
MSTGTSVRRLRDHAARWRGGLQPHATESAPLEEPRGPGKRAQFLRFGLHYVEMCVAMCVGFAIGDAIFFALAGLTGHSKPFTELPVLSVLVVTVSMTAPMTAWMLYRGMPRRIVAEMSAAMPVLAIALLCLAWIGAIPTSAMAPAEHGLMMPAMLMPMLLRLDFYTGRTSDVT